VKQAYLNLREAEERVPASQLTVKQAEENFDIATGRYAAGVGNPIEITDASVRLSSAKLGYIQALFDDKIAQASLEKAMGVR
jgi:outer membrane protein TolC